MGVMKRIGLLLGLVGVLSAQAWAVTNYVAISSTNPVPPYTSWATAATNIQDAVDVAANSDTVWITNGVYALSSEIAVDKAVTIQSVNGPDFTTVDGGGRSRCFNLASSGCVVSGFTIANGYHPQTGGGIKCSPGSPAVVTNCTIAGNSSYVGGGVYCGTINDCLVIGNSVSGNGGGLYLYSGGTASDCIISGNSAYAGGGLVYGTVTNCTITGNTATNGGGTYDATLVGCVISDNHASNVAGGMGHGKAYNCTIVTNSALGDGGGMYNAEAYNSIIWNNGPDDLFYSPATNSCSPDLVHGIDGNITNAPMFIDPENDDYRLADSSPCIDAGSIEVGFGLFDLAGNPREVGFSVDMGAHEWNSDGEPWLMVSPTTYSLSVTQGEEVSNHTFEVKPLQTSSVDYSLSSDVEWLTVDSFSGTSTGEVDEISMIFDLDGFGPGMHAGRITLVSAEVSNSPVHVSVEMFVFPTNIYVSSEIGSDLNSGFSWDLPKATIQGAVDTVTEGGTVWVSNGTYNLASEIVVYKDITIRSVNGAETVVVDGNGATRCFNLGSAACVLDGLTITNGYSTGSGGGVYCDDHTPILTNCVVVGNQTTATAGGIWKGTLYGCVIADNIASDGTSEWKTAGGMWQSHVYDSLITRNKAHMGGGGYGCKAYRCTFLENEALYYGGGMHISGGYAENCKFLDNTAGGSGGALYASGIARNCLISGNHGTYGGGGVRNATLYNCTVINNTSDDTGGGIEWGNAYNCIITDNTAVAGYDNIYTSTVVYSCSPCLIPGVDGNITNAPMFVSAGHIAVDSPCREVGSSSYTAGVDLDGEVWLSPPSMGCDEVHEGSLAGAIALSIESESPSVMVDGYLTLSGNVSGLVSRIEWDFGDGAPLANQTEVSYAWSSRGTYDVVLTAFNSTYPDGLSATQTVQVLSLADVAVYVAPDGNDANDGSDWANAKATIQAGVDAQGYEGAVVWITNGVYYPSSEIWIDKDIEVRSVNGPEVTIVDGSGSNRCFNLQQSACVLDGFTITNGYYELDGGGMHANSLDPVLTNCVIIGNVAGDDGGGVVKGTLYDCVVSNNISGNRGGGAYLSSCYDSVISGNWSSDYGGGLYDCTATDSTISGNYSDRSGGGMKFGTAYACVLSENTALETGGGMQGSTLYDCFVSGNQTLLYGGGGVQGSSARVHRCVISGNYAITVGGGAASAAQLFNCLIMDNEAANSGGGINDCKAVNCTIMGNRSSDGGGVSFGTASARTVNNSIVYGNSASASGVDIYMNNRTEAGTFNSCSPDLEHGVDGNITNAPIFASWGHLAAGSPCIGAASSNDEVETDIDGQAWLNPPSMGCREFYGSGPVTGELSVAINGYPVELAGYSSELYGEVIGAATMHIWDFGDGSVATNELFPVHVWDVSGYYDVVLSAFNDTYPAGVSVTQAVQVIVAGDKAVWEGNGHFYQVVAAPDGITWDEAKAEAAARGGYLATPVTADENDFIFGMTQCTNFWNANTGPWLGGLQLAGGIEPDGGWVWDTGEAWIYENWNLAEPNNYQGTENRVNYQTSSSGWNDKAGENNTYGYVVEFQIHESATGDLAVGIGDAGRIAVGYPLMLAARLEGMATRLEWDFADGVTATNTHYPVHAWDAPGEYDVVLTAYNADHPGGISATQAVHVLSVADGTIHVATDGNDANDGLGWASAKATIQGGVDEAPAGGIVWVSNGTYAVTETVLVDKDLDICSVNGPAETVVDGLASNRCFTLETTACTLSGLTISNGYSADNGGGVYCSALSSTITNCVIKGNKAERSGGIYGGTVWNSSIVGNEALSQGGGGVTAAHLYDSQIISNKAARYGGGALSCNMTGCELSYNECGIDGGGCHASDLINCFVYTNRSAASGGGVNDGRVVNCSISGNTAGNSGGGVHGSDIYNSIIWGNQADNGPNLNYFSIASYCCSPDLVDGVDGNITNAPLFVSQIAGDYRLQPNSPCINWGNNAFAIGAFDVTNNPRIVEGYVDMGCYEYQGMVGLDGDMDGNGYLDSWEREYFGGHVDADANADGDSQSNGEEYVSGTDPTNAASYFNSSVSVDGSSFVIKWTAVTGRVYNVYWTPSLFEEFEPLEIGIQYPVNSYTDLVHSAESSGYYRVVAMRADYDLDGDGLPNDWESRYVAVDAFADLDKDGYNNLSEFISGTDPANKVSFFTAASSVAEVNGTNCFVVEWISIPDRLYSVQWTTNLAAGFQILESDIEHPQNSYTDTVHAVEESGYYKVDVKLK
jgi:PKD repeat protein